jgi:hypothetical protein
LVIWLAGLDPKNRQERVTGKLEYPPATCGDVARRAPLPPRGQSHVTLPETHALAAGSTETNNSSRALKAFVAHMQHWLNIGGYSTPSRRIIIGEPHESGVLSSVRSINSPMFDAIFKITGALG